MPARGEVGGRLSAISEGRRSSCARSSVLGSYAMTHTLSGVLSLSMAHLLAERHSSMRILSAPSVAPVEAPAPRQVARSRGPSFFSPVARLPSPASASAPNVVDVPHGGHRAHDGARERVDGEQHCHRHQRAHPDLRLTIRHQSLVHHGAPSRGAAGPASVDVAILGPVRSHTLRKLSGPGTPAVHTPGAPHSFLPPLAVK